MSPFINSAGLLCVGGRLKAANIPPNSKHQILISKHHPIDIHWNYAHRGKEYTHCILRQNYWIPASRSLIRKTSNSFFCKRQNTKPVQPQMVNLSNISLQSHVKPFSNTSVDYFGPTKAKTRRNQRTLKSYEVNVLKTYEVNVSKTYVVTQEQLITNFLVTCRLIPLFYRYIHFSHERACQHYAIR